MISRMPHIFSNSILYFAHIIEQNIQNTIIILDECRCMTLCHNSQVRLHELLPAIYNKKRILWKKYTLNSEKKRKERDARHHAKVIWKLNLNCVENGEKACFYKINLISSSYLFLLYARSNKSHIYTSSLFPPIIPYNAQHKFFICFKWNENSTWGYNILMWTCIITFAS